MHELSIALSILDVAAEEAERRGAAAVMAIHVRIGPLSGVVPEALASAFELAREGSPFPQAELVIEHAPVVLFCPNCQSEQPAHSLQLLTCSVCDTPGAKVVSGNEMDIIALELPDPAALPSPQPALQSEG